MAIRLLDVRAKIISTLLIVAGIAVAAIAYIGYQSGRANLDRSISLQLTSLREVTARELEFHFDTVRDHMTSLSDDLMVIDAVKAFDATLEDPAIVVDDSINQALGRYYGEVYIPKLSQTSSSKPVVEAYIPRSAPSRYFQYQYIVKNDNEVGAKQTLNDAKDGSAYSAVHRRFHQSFLRIQEAFDYEDVFLINKEGLIMYSVLKETDYMTSLLTGPYQDSGLGKAFRAARREQGARFVHIEDYSFYRPSYGAPAAFLITPIFEGGQFLGALAIQLSSQKVNRIVSYNNRWKDVGLGESGESFLVGSDRRLRTVVRPFVENREGYLKDIRRKGTDSEIIERIKLYNTPILLQSADSVSVNEAISGKAGIRRIENDYRGRPALSSSAPLKIKGLNWVIVLEMPLEEAYEPIYAFQQRIIIASALLSILLTVMAMVAAYIFMKPVKRMVERAEKVGSGDLSVDLALDRDDEFGDLSRTFQSMVDTLRERSASAESQRQRSESMLSRFLPTSVVRVVNSKSFASEELHVGEPLASISMISVHMSGYEEQGMSKDAREMVKIFDNLLDIVERIADRHGIEQVRLSSTSYLAVSGLSAVHLDHERRALMFAIEFRRAFDHFWKERGFDGVRLSIALASGPAIAGVVGKKRLSFLVWGKPIALLNKIGPDARPGDIRVEAGMARNLKDSFEFTVPETGEGMLYVSNTGQERA